MTATPTTFLDLLRRAQDGDNDARGTLLERYRVALEARARPQLGGVLRQKLSGRDLVQEAFAHALRRLDQFSGAAEQQFIRWLETTLDREVTATVRRYVLAERRDIRREQVFAAEPPARQTTPSEVAGRADEEARLRAALGRLPTEQRLTLELHDLAPANERLTLRRIGELLDVSENAVQKLRARALLKLQALMGGDR